MADTPPTPPRRLVSLRLRFVWLLIGVIGIFAGGMTLSYLSSRQSNNEAEIRLLDVEARQSQASVLQSWRYYRELVDNLARDPELVDMMLVGSSEDLQEWALSRQRLLPGILGLALVSPRGMVYGDANLLRVGPSCQRDLLQPDAHKPRQNYIHRDFPGLEHVDLVAEVRDGGQAPLGKVFVSIRLSHLQQLINSATQPGHVILIQDGAGNLVVGSGTLQENVREIRLPLPAMGWELVVQSSLRNFYDGGRHILAGMLTLVGVLVLLLVVVLRLRRPVLQDLDAALGALTCLTRNESAPHITTRYVEFSHAAEDINRIAQQLSDQREQLATLSMTDSLTGLPNRRAFETQFPHMLGLADRGHPIALVLLDVDHFKAINDTLGHAAGDKALVALARALKALTRSADMTARLAGDEFTVLLAGLDNQGVQAWYLRLADRFRSELNAAGLEVDNTLSAGHTWLQSLTGDSIGRALARADHALYAAKERGRGQLVCEAPLVEKDQG